jgi:hypothetical protein
MSVLHGRPASDMYCLALVGTHGFVSSNACWQ